MKELFQASGTRYDNAPLCAIVLAGGQSKRMGTDKAWLTFGGETFLQLICRSLLANCQPVIVVAAAEQVVPELPTGVLVARDTVPNSGPLGGFLTGLEAVHRVVGGVKAPVWLCSVDAPFCCVDVIESLAVLLGDKAAVAVSEGKRLHPLSAIYNSDLLPLVRRIFDSGERRLSAILDVSPVHSVNAESLRTLDPELAFLISVNTPKQFDAARAHHAKVSASPGVAKPKLP